MRRLLKNYEKHPKLKHIFTHYCRS